MKAVIPLLGLVIGTATGVGAGYILVPADTQPTESLSAAASVDDGPETAEPLELVTLNNQFVVPVIKADRVDALVVLSIGLCRR